MPQRADSGALQDKLTLELRRGLGVLAALSQLETARYGYSLQQRLAERGLEIEQGTLYPLLRRLDEQGLLESEWKVEGSRPRKYYRLSPAGAQVLRGLTAKWNEVTGAMEDLLSSQGVHDDGAD